MLRMKILIPVLSLTVGIITVLSLNFYGNTRDEEKYILETKANNVLLDKSELHKIKNISKEDEESDQNKIELHTLGNNGQSNKAQELKTPIVSYSKIFSKAIFLGDSITEGLTAYEYIDEEHVIAEKGLTALKALKLKDEILKGKPDKVFILIGANDSLYNITTTKFASNYEQLIKNIVGTKNSRKVYIQSIFPVGRKATEKKPELNNKRIEELNKELKKLAKKMDIPYIDISSKLKDDEGWLKNEYSTDGIHLKYKYYQIWLDIVSKYNSKA